ncbi:winged helix-turn-helix transcriptional regulator [Mycobacterium kyogaense]|uniref:winged helix-turn-helix transcriptional regulator n=1 Tax=Mycobacterium kyogaense TaxID=2212479 RepID=UPI000DAF0499|nr:winged helix-turn-helix transcriptional regulator [Mycobacterium kyogaense]
MHGQDSLGDTAVAGCVLAHAQDGFQVLKGRWKLEIVHQLFLHSSLRFSQLERQIPEVTQKVLIQQLRSLEADGVIARVTRPVVPPHVEYRLTDDGRRLRETLEALDRWTRARSQG